MKVQDLVVEVRNADFQRVGQITERDLVGLQVVARFNAVGSWTITLPADSPMADALRAPSAGIIVTGASGVLMSGFTVSARSVKTSENPEGVWEISGLDDTAVLGHRIAYPTPALADIAAQGDYDVRTGPAETVMKEYVDANLGASAPSIRRVPTLTVEADAGRGLDVLGRARYQSLGELCKTLALTSGLGFDIIQDGAGLQFNVFEPVDRSQSIRMDIDNNRLTKSEYSYTAPQATRVIVAGQGSGADRTLVEIVSDVSEDAEMLWNRRIEVFKDQRNTSDLGELAQAGEEILADKGFTVESVSVTPSDDDTMNFPTDWGLGDKVSVVVGDITISQIVTEVAILVLEDGVKVGATVGDPAVAAQGDVESQVITTQSDQETRISNLERNDIVSSSGGSSGYNVDGGLPNTIFGGSDPIDAGGI